MQILSAFVLNLVAMIAMTIDHTYHTLYSNIDILNHIGRIAFPIFAFFIVEGFYKTSDRTSYARRLFIFGLVSEIPFNYMLCGSASFLFHQNVMFELFIGLLAIHRYEELKLQLKLKNYLSVVLNILIIFGLINFANLTMLDYREFGIALILMFAISRDVKYTKLFQLAGMVAIFILWYKGNSWVIPIGTYEWYLPKQALCILALPLIWMYNGKQGYTNKYYKYFRYGFYPLHLIVLTILRGVLK